MDDRKKLLASVDMMSEELKGLREQVSLHVAREVEAEVAANESRKMANQCYAKIREIEPMLNQIVAKLSGREK